MKRFIFLTFGFLTLAFYELSGGSDFDPVAARNAAILARSEGIEVSELPAVQTAQSTSGQTDASLPTVTRISLNLTSLDDVLAEDPATAQQDATKITASANNQNDVTPVSFDEDTDAAPVLPSIIFPGSTTQASSGSVSSPQDIRLVDASAVNMRGGPGTNYDVVKRLSRDTQVEVLQDDGTGWVKLRPVTGGPEGWIADYLLTKG